MKRILITGLNSYVGNSFDSYMKKYDGYEIDKISVRGNEWKNLDFSKYDVILHVAGIAHADTGGISKKNQDMYYKINRDLTIEVAKKYKLDRRNKLSQFIYLSSIIVYGDIASVTKRVIIGDKTEAKPSNYYGESKLQAEKLLEEMADKNYVLTIVRPPMIYGENCKGNYLALKKIANRSPIFPNYPNQRSVIEINVFCCYLQKYIENSSSGIKKPQNDKYKSTADLVLEIAKKNNTKIKTFKILNIFIPILSYIPGKIGVYTKKAFGNLVYEQNINEKE